MLELSSSRRRALRARAHHLHPLVMIGNAGLTPAVLREIDIALKSHELVKLRVLGDDRAARPAILTGICDALEAAPVQSIGKIMVVFRPKPAEAPPKTAGRAPGNKRPRKAPRRTKRSFQMQ
jgi:putative YhbY family RNA-binding protein